MKKRYHTPNQIRDDIDKWKRKVQSLLDSASQLDLVADKYYESGQNIEIADWNRTQAEKQRKSAYRIENRKLVHLKHKLAEFLTRPLPNIDPGDGSVDA